MKKIVLISFFIAGQTLFAHPFNSIGLKGVAGYTAVDIEKALEIEGSSELDDWDQFNRGGLLQGLIEIQENLLIGPEFGYQFLYYGLERYVYIGANWREWYVETLHLGAVIEKNFNSPFYIQTGLNLRYFLDGSGITPALLASIGLNIHFPGGFSLPVEARTDVVFGSATPIGIVLGIGLTYDLK